jgi:serine/threonine-protein kinase
MKASELSPADWVRIEALFHEVIEQPADTRSDYVAERAAGDEWLHAWVAALLRGHASGRVSEDPGASRREAIQPGDRVGPFRIVSLLGTGGMGSVFLGEREVDGFAQRVAVKLIRVGLDDPAVRERFRLERGILVSLDHAGVARFIDGGITDSGQPWLAMEYVRGTPILDWADRHGLTVRQRIRLFLDVCDIVRHAHARLVVHRDLKPAHILVTDDGHVKLLDFGIARLQDEHAPGGAPAARWLTPEYASPEQVRGDALSTASDVYQLGLTLYELLAGRPPYTFASRSQDHIARVIREMEPVRPSAAFAHAAASPDRGRRYRPVDEPDVAPDDVSRRAPEARAKARHTTVDRLGRQLAGDLDAIVLRTLAKQPADRYASVEQLADDLQRHLDSQPIHARPRSVPYQVRRFIRRHRTAAVAGALVAVALLGGLGIALREARNAARQTRIAERERDYATQLAGVLTDMFRVPDPDQSMGENISAREVLDRGAGRIERDFGGEPFTRAALLSEIAQVYHNLGAGPRAAELLRQALAIQSAPAGPAATDLTARSAGDGALATTLDRLGWIESALGMADSARIHLERAVELRENDGPAGPALAASLFHLGHVLTEQGRHAEARARLGRAIDIWRGDRSRDDDVPAAALLALANAEHGEGDFDLATRHFEQIIARFDGRREPPDPSLATALYNMGMIHQLSGRYAEAEPLIQEALAMRRSLYGPEHPHVLQSLMSLAALMNELRRPFDAEPLFREIAERSAQVLAPDHPNVSIAWQGMAAALHQMGEQDSSLVLFDRIIAGQQSQLGADHALVAYNVIQSGEPLLTLGRYQEALLRFDDAASRLSRQPAGGHPYLALAGFGRARALHGIGRDRDAFTTFDSAFAMAGRTLRPDHRFVLDGRQHLASFLGETGDAAAADTIFADVLARRRVIDADRPGNLVAALVAYSRFLDRQYRSAEAVPLLREALDIRSRLAPPGHRLVTEIQAALDHALARANRTRSGAPR